MVNTEIKIHALRLLPDQDLKTEIKALCLANNIQAGWVVTCVGSLSRAHLRMVGRPEGQMIQGPLEIVSLVGTVSVNGCHLHICVSNKDGNTKGGHLLEGNVIFTTAELIIGESQGMIFTREIDQTTGWNELKINAK